MLKEAAGIKKVVLRLGKTDLRRGIDGLVSIIRLSGNMDPMEIGTLYLFCGSRPDRIKGITFEGDGFLLLTKRLSRENRFQWPRSADELRAITRKQYENLMDGFSVESTIKMAEKNLKKIEPFKKKYLQSWHHWLIIGIYLL